MPSLRARMRLTDMRTMGNMGLNWHFLTPAAGKHGGSHAAPMTNMGAHDFQPHPMFSTMFSNDSQEETAGQIHYSHVFQAQVYREGRVMIDDEEIPLVEVIGRQHAARRIARLLNRGEHHVIGCTGPAAILSTTAALHSMPVTHHLDDGRTVSVTADPLTEDLRDAVQQGAIWWSVSAVPTASVTVARLAALIGATPAPGTAVGVFHRRSSSRPDRAPPLLRDAYRRLAAYQQANQSGRNHP